MKRDGGLSASRIEKLISLADHEIVRILERYTETVQLPVRRVQSSVGEEL